MTRIGEFGRNAATAFQQISPLSRFKKTVQFAPSGSNLDTYTQNLLGYTDTFKQEKSPFFTSEEIGNALGISFKKSQAADQIQRLLDLNHDGGVDTAELATTIAYVDGIEQNKPANGKITWDKRKAFKKELGLQRLYDPLDALTNSQKQKALARGQSLVLDPSELKVGLNSTERIQQGGPYLDASTLSADSDTLAEVEKLGIKPEDFQSYLNGLDGKILNELGEMGIDPKLINEYKSNVPDLKPVNTPENLAKASAEGVKAFQMPLSMILENFGLQKKYEQFRLDTQA